MQEHLSLFIWANFMLVLSFSPQIHLLSGWGWRGTWHAGNILVGTASGPDLASFFRRDPGELGEPWGECVPRESFPWQSLGAAGVCCGHLLVPRAWATSALTICSWLGFPLIPGRGCPLPWPLALRNYREERFLILLFTHMRVSVC